MPTAPAKCSHSLGDSTPGSVTDTLSDVKVTSCDFQLDAARMIALAAAGHIVHIVSAGDEFVFQGVKPRTRQGALKGKARIAGDRLITGLAWESSPSRISWTRMPGSSARWASLCRCWRIKRYQATGIAPPA